jgi:hypothetical protein
VADRFAQICEVIETRTGKAPMSAGHNRVKALCPAHADDKPSLSVRKDEERGKIYARCFAGCSFNDIIEALDLTARDFNLSSNGNGQARTNGHRPAPAAPERTSGRKSKSEVGKEIERYAYTDEDDNPLYYNIRFEPKDFRLADKHGKRANLPKNQRWVPYRLSRVLQAVADGRTVYWVEGERDVHSLEAIGEVATTNAGGGNRPLEPEWAQYFEGADVVVVCDRDKTGQSYGRSVARMLINAVNSVRLSQSATPQVKSDVTDHLNAGYSPEQLEAVPMRSIRRTRWSLSAIMDTPPEPLRWVLPGVIPEGLTLLVGAPKVGKSWWNINLMAALGTGRPKDVFDWGQEIQPSDNLYLALEDPHRRIYSRMRQVMRGLHIPRGGLPGDVWLDLPAIEKNGKEEIEKWLDVHPSARAVLVDVLAKVRGGGNAESGLYQADYAAVSILKEIADDYGIGVIVTHHDRKKTSEDFLDMVSGTKGVTGAADTILYLTRERGSTEGLLRVESRDVEECQYKMLFVRETGRWNIMDREELGADTSRPRVELKDEIEQLLVTRGYATVSELSELLHRTPQEILTELQKSEQSGAVARKRDGGWHVPKQ